MRERGGQPGRGAGVREALPQPGCRPAPLSGGAHEEWVLDFCRGQPLLLSAPSLPGQVQRPSSPGWEAGEEGGGARAPEATPFGEQAPELGRRSREAGARAAGFTRPLHCGRPAPLPSRRPSSHPAPQIRAPRRGAQESHQLPPLSGGPAAPRASLGAASSSSPSPSSSSPSVNSSWPGP